MSSAAERMRKAKRKREAELRATRALEEAELAKKKAAEEKRKARATAKKEAERMKYSGKPSESLIRQLNQTTNIEIDYSEFKKLVAKNANDTNPDEDLIFRICFKPYYKGGKLVNRGRQEALTDAIFRVLQANAKKLVKKVTREEII